MTELSQALDELESLAKAKSRGALDKFCDALDQLFPELIRRARLTLAAEATDDAVEAALTEHWRAWRDDDVSNLDCMRAALTAASYAARYQLGIDDVTLGLIREALEQAEIPHARLIVDHVKNALTLLQQERARAEAAEKALAETRQELGEAIEALLPFVETTP